MDAPIYALEPIRSLNALARALDEPLELLSSLAIRADQLYRPVPQKKKNGEPRPTFEALEPLKHIQRKIVDRLLVRVTFPSYVHGGIRDKQSPRSIITNAAPHASAKQVVLMDIEDFYPSVRRELVRSIYSEFFSFSEDVSEMLTRLCCRNNSVPQGASPSSYLANLAFWDIEANVVQDFRSRQLVYTRFADDITISSSRYLSNTDTSHAVSKVTTMLARRGFKQKRAKFHVRKKGQPLFDSAGKTLPLTVTGLTISGAAPQVSKMERRRIRAMVGEYEQLVNIGLSARQIGKKYSVVRGHVGRLIATKHPDGLKLKRRLQVAHAIATSGVVPQALALNVDLMPVSQPLQAVELVG